MNKSKLPQKSNQYQQRKLLHGFDDTGRLYSPSGQKRVWWPSETSDQFGERAKCFVRQYTQEIFVGGTVDGRMTLSENIADNGGLMAAYQVRAPSSSTQPLIPNRVQIVPGLQVFNDEEIPLLLHARFAIEAGSLTRTFLRARSALFHRICALLLLHDEVGRSVARSVCGRNFGSKEGGTK